MTQHIKIVPYDINWPWMFESESRRIRQILGPNCAAIYHIGSTSVPGLAAKPVIDIMPVVFELETVDAAAGEFEKAGYEYMGEFGITGRRYLRKGGCERTHQVHIFRQEDRYTIGRHLAFRDYLRCHCEEAERYARLKICLAERYPYDIEGYCDGKEKFVKEMEEKALIWAAKNEHEYV